LSIGSLKAPRLLLRLYHVIYASTAFRDHGSSLLKKKKKKAFRDRAKLRSTRMVSLHDVSMLLFQRGWMVQSRSYQGMGGPACWPRMRVKSMRHQGWRQTIHPPGH